MRGQFFCNDLGMISLVSVENMWVQSRLVEGRLVVLAVRRGTAPL
jgi:hypothetical protein